MTLAKSYFQTKRWGKTRFRKEAQVYSQSSVNYAKRSKKCLARHDITISLMLKLLHIFNILGVL